MNKKDSKVGKIKKKRVEKIEVAKSKKFYATYVGPHKTISLSPGIGRVMRGVLFEVTEDVANTLKLDKNFTVKVE